MASLPPLLLHLPQLLLQLNDRVQRQEVEMQRLQTQLESLTQEVGATHRRPYPSPLQRLPARASRHRLRLVLPAPAPLLLPLPDRLTARPPALQRDELSERAATLSTNISCLYNTAKLELQRKDSEIQELRGRSVDGWVGLMHACFCVCLLRMLVGMQAGGPGGTGLAADTRPCPCPQAGSSATGERTAAGDTAAAARERRCHPTL